MRGFQRISRANLDKYIFLLKKFKNYERYHLKACIVFIGMVQCYTTDDYDKLSRNPLRSLARVFVGGSNRSSLVTVVPPLNQLGVSFSAELDWNLLEGR